MEEYIKSLQELIDKAKVPFTSFPSTLLSIVAPFRPGLSAKRIASEIISKQAEAGAPVGPLPDGTRNVSEGMEVIRIESIVKALHEDSKIQLTIPPGAIYIKAIGSNSGGPVISEGTNINVITGEGIIS